MGLVRYSLVTPTPPLFDLSGSGAVGPFTLPAGMTFTRASAGLAEDLAGGAVVTAGLAANVACRVRTQAGNVGGLNEAAHTNDWPVSNSTSTGAGLLAGSGDTYTTGIAGPDASANDAERIAIASGGYSKYKTTGAVAETRSLSAWVKKGPGSGRYQLANYFNAANGSLAVGTASASTWTRVIAPPVTFPLANHAYIPNDSEDPATAGLPAGADALGVVHDALFDFIHSETGKVVHSPVKTTGAAATCAATAWKATAGSAFVSGGRMTFVGRCIPLAAPADYPADVVVLVDAVSLNEGASIDAAGVMTVRIAGVANTTAALVWAAGDVLDISIQAGGGVATVVKYRRNGGATVTPAVAGAVLGAWVPAGAVQFYGIAGVNMFDCIIQTIDNRAAEW